MSLLLLAIFAWQFWHFQKQNLGLVAFTARSQRVPPLTRPERTAIKSAGAAGIIGMVAHPQLLGLNVRLPLESVWPIAGVLLVASVCYGLALIAGRTHADRPSEFGVIYVLSLLFWMPVFIFDSPYAAVGGMTIAHGLQYLVLVGVALATSGSGSVGTLRVGIALMVALLAGAALSWASHLHSSPPLLRVLFGAYLGVLMAHFVLDSLLWRMRDPLARAFLARRLPFLLP